MDPELIADRYRVVRPIGRGGMGTVWLCEDGVLNRRVAVKRIGGLPGDDIDQAARAMREARVTAALNHDHAVSVFDVVDDGGATWLVMEYVPSRTLAELIKTEGPLTPRRAATIGGQVADALATAHGLAILHRDVKPGNILVSEGDRAKISDFGIARGHTDLTLTQTGMMIGTPTYFAPELARGEHPSFASDVWALGATLFSAVEGKPPFPAQETPLATLGLIARESAPRAERAGPLADVIAAMLAREPTQRWSMERVRNALDEVAQSDTMPVESPVRVEATAPDPTPAASASPPPRAPAPTASPDVARDPRTGTSGRDLAGGPLGHRRGRRPHRPGRCRARHLGRTQQRQSAVGGGASRRRQVTEIRRDGLLSHVTGRVDEHRVAAGDVQHPAGRRLRQQLRGPSRRLRERLLHARS